MTSKEEQNSEIIKKMSESEANNSQEFIVNNKVNENSKELISEYRFGWSRYSEIMNGRFAMIGILSIIIIEILSRRPFLQWSGILN